MQLGREGRTVGKWAALLVTLAAAGLMVGTCWWDADWNSPGPSSPQWHVALAGGRVQVVRVLSWATLRPGLVVNPSLEAWRWGWGDQPELPPGAHWRCGFVYWEMKGTLWHFEMTLLYPALLCGAGAAVLWWPDVRPWVRRRRGLCPSCGYERSGLEVGAACPECGMAATRPAA
jgi:hypothetical protein